MNKILTILIGLLLINTVYGARYVDPTYLWVFDDNAKNLKKVSLSLPNASISQYTTVLHTSTSLYHLTPTLQYVFGNVGNAAYLDKLNKSDYAYEYYVGNLSAYGIAVLNSNIYMIGNNYIVSRDINTFSENWINTDFDGGKCAGLGGSSTVIHGMLSYMSSLDLFVFGCTDETEGLYMFYSNGSMLQYNNLTYGGTVIENLLNIDVDATTIYTNFISDSSYYLGSTLNGESIIDVYNLSSINFSLGASDLSPIVVVDDYIYVGGADSTSMFKIYKFNKDLDLIETLNLGSPYGQFRSLVSDYDDKLYAVIYNTNTSNRGLYEISIPSFTVTDSVLGLISDVGVASYQGGETVGQTIANITVSPYYNNVLVTAASNVVCILYDSAGNLQGLDVNDASGSIAFTSLVLDSYRMTCEINTGNASFSPAYPSAIIEKNFTVTSSTHHLIYNWFDNVDGTQKVNINLVLTDYDTDEYIVNESSIAYLYYQSDGVEYISQAIPTGALTVSVPSGISFCPNATSLGYKNPIGYNNICRVSATGKDYYVKLEKDYTVNRAPCYVYGWVSDANGNALNNLDMVAEVSNPSDTYSEPLFGKTNASGYYNITSIPTDYIVNLWINSSSLTFVNSWVSASDGSSTCYHQENASINSTDIYSFYFFDGVNGNTLDDLNFYLKNEANVTLKIFGRSNAVDCTNNKKCFKVPLINSTKYYIDVVADGYTPLNVSHTADNSDKDILYNLYPIDGECFVTLYFVSNSLYDEDSPEDVIFVDYAIKNSVTGLSKTGRVSAQDDHFVYLGGFSRSAKVENINVDCGISYKITAGSMYFKLDNPLDFAINYGVKEVDLSLTTITKMTLKQKYTYFDAQLFRVSETIFWLAMIVIGLFFVANGVMMLRQIGF